MFRRNFEHALIAVDLHDISRPGKHRGAFLADLHTAIDIDAEVRLHLTVDIIRDFPPDFFTFQVHGFVPFSNASGRFQLPPRPGARTSGTSTSTQKPRLDGPGCNPDGLRGLDAQMLDITQHEDFAAFGQRSQRLHKQIAHFLELQRLGRNLAPIGEILRDELALVVFVLQFGKAS